MKSHGFILVALLISLLTVQCVSGQMTDADSASAVFAVS
jgi:hypothetical protein